MLWADAMTVFLTEEMWSGSMKNEPTAYQGPDRIFAPFRYYADKLAVARKHGFSSWHEFITEAYAQYQSCYRVAKIAGMSVYGIHDTLRKFGVKRAGQGTGWYCLRPYGPRGRYDV